MRSLQAVSLMAFALAIGLGQAQAQTPGGGKIVMAEKVKSLPDDCTQARVASLSSASSFRSAERHFPSRNQACARRPV